MGRDFTGYGEIRIKRVPEELKELIRVEAKKLGVDERAVMLMRLWGDERTPYRGSYKPPAGTNSTPNRSPNKPPKFEAPSEAEADAEIVAKGYHFSGREFVAWNGARGWRTKQGPMKDWRAAMVTWETRWKEKHEGGGQGAAVGTQGYDTSGNRELVEAIKAGKGW